MAKLLCLQGLFSVFFVVVTLMRSAVESQPEGECRLLNTCFCQYDNGYRVDLTPLDGNGTPLFQKIFDGKYFYDVNLCSNFSSQYCNDSTVCQIRDVPDRKFTFSCSQIDGAYFAQSETGLTYNMIRGKDGRMVRVDLHCNETDVGSLTALGEPTNLTYAFVLTSRYACAHLPPEQSPNENL
ncbi:uncharacterized protein [Oscarella lobularis]|uniref:uncharacterized protein n=1 Tax=Oscarella lobularis TaxID=121494 RepID=UPI003313B14B